MMCEFYAVDWQPPQDEFMDGFLCKPRYSAAHSTDSLPKLWLHFIWTLHGH